MPAGVFFLDLLVVGGGGGGGSTHGGGGSGGQVVEIRGVPVTPGDVHAVTVGAGGAGGAAGSPNDGVDGEVSRFGMIATAVGGGGGGRGFLSALPGKQSAYGGGVMSIDVFICSNFVV